MDDGVDVFVARQPIFEQDGSVHGYELLYRAGGDSTSADGTDPNQMSRDVIIQSFLDVGLDSLTGGALGFINFGRIGSAFPQQCFTHARRQVDAFNGPRRVR